MQKSLLLAAAAAVVTGSTAARADDIFTLDKITITGSKTVPTEQLRAAVKEQIHTKVTTADIVADQDNISAVLGKANVVGGIKTSMVNKPGHHVEVIFAVTDNGAEAPKVTTVAPKLQEQIFKGNVRVTSDELQKASGVNPGDDLSNEKIAAVQNKLAAVYKAKKIPVDVNISGAVATGPDGAVVTWTIVETKAKKKKGDDAPQKQEEY